jgi:phosphoadenosine phosphosulfate reductase
MIGLESSVSPSGRGAPPGAVAKLYQDLPAPALLRATIRRLFPGRIAVVSSFGAESAAVLALVAGIDPAVPVIFLDTAKHFPETLAYRDALVARLGLSDIRVVRPDPARVAAHDPDGDLWRRDPDRCCALRKALPLERALEGFDAWITGRKRFHGDSRAALPTVEAVDGRVKINPLANWSAAQIERFIGARGLPRHPLVDAGFASIGCAPCTAPVTAGEAARSGRWRDIEKTECGIHNAKGTRQ